MIKIITALGNPNLNYELQKYNEFKVIGNDIIYYDGIIEILEKNENIDYLIISDVLDEKSEIESLIEQILKINRRIKIIAIINRKNKLLENSLLRKGVCDIFFDDENITDVINFLKTKNIEYLNTELREEINNLKSLILEKNIKKNIFYKSNILNNHESKIIGITGARGIGKTTFCTMFASAIKRNNKILIIDFDLINAHIGEIYNKKIEYSKIDELNIKNYIINIDDNLDILIGLNILYYYKKLDFIKIKKEIINLKKIYNYIIVDTYTENEFDNNKYIYELFDEIFLLSGTDKLGVLKSEKIINLIKNKWKIDFKKIKLVYYRINFIENIKSYFSKYFSEISFVRKNNE